MPDTIQTLSDQWVKEYANPIKMDAHPFDIEKAALLILDMQRYFLDSDSHAYIPSAKEILAGLNQAVGFFRSRNRPVIATRHMNSVENAGMMGSWWSELITEDHALFDLDPDLEIHPEEILNKPQYDAFYLSDLEIILEQNRIDQLVIGGVMTHLCCETTARSAFVRGFEVFFLVDGTATYNRVYHEATLQNLGHGFAVLSTIKTLLSKE